MLKKGKKFLLLLLALALTVGALAGCGNYRSDALDGYTPSDNAAESNGGFVVKKDSWYYFINGAEDYTADNTYGDVVKGSLMRISETDLSAGNYAEADVVVPQLIVAQDHTSGIFIYGDYVYYATPNTTRNMEGTVENSYLDFKRARLDGTDTMRNYYVQVSDNSTEYRYVQGVDGTVYLVYVDAAESEIHSFNTETLEDTVLVSGYSDYEFDAVDPESSTIYYTMAVPKMNTYSNGEAQDEEYNQLWRVDVSATAEDGHEFDLKNGYTDPALHEGDENYMLEYTNLGELVLDGIGTNRTGSTFNVDWAEGVSAKSARGFTYSFVKYTGGKVFLSVINLDASTVAFVYCLDGAGVGENWNSITANPDLNGASGQDTEALTLITTSSGTATASSLYYVNEDEELCYLYLDSSGSIARVTVGSGENGEDDPVYIAKQQSGASLLFIEGDYLYYSKTGTNGNALWRVRYNGTSDNYNIFTGDAYTNDDYKPMQVLQLDYNSSWYAPEVLGDHLFFSNAETNADNYVYVFDLRDAETNAVLKTLNDRYADVQDMFTEVSSSFADAANAMRFYYYVGSDDVIQEEVHKSEYQEQDLELLQAFIACSNENSHGFDFGSLKEGDALYNTQAAFYSLLGYRSDDDQETYMDTLTADYVLGTEEEE